MSTQGDSTMRGDYLFAWDVMEGGHNVYLGKVGFRIRNGDVQKKIGNSMRAGWGKFDIDYTGWKAMFEYESRLFYLDRPGGKEVR